MWVTACRGMVLDKVVSKSIDYMKYFLKQSLVVPYLLQLGKTMTIGCFLLLDQWSRVKIKDL